MIKFKELINTKIIETTDFNITVYNVALVFAILIITGLIISILKRLVKRQEKKKGFDKGRTHSVIQIIKYILWIAAILLSLQAIGVKITLLLAGSAALLVGLGLGLQQIFQDIMSGIVILFEGVLKVDDIVEIKDGGIIGVVTEIGLRTSEVTTRDDIIMIIPNSKFVTDSVINWSHTNKKTRFSVDVGVAYGSDIKKVQHLLLQSADNNAKIATDPKPFVRFTNFGDSSLDFSLFFWTTHTISVEDIKSEIRFSIDALFRSHNVQIPFPQRDLHIKKELM